MKTNEPVNLPSNLILVMLSSVKSFYIQKKGCLTRLAWKQHDNSTSNSMQCSKSHKLSGGQRVKLLGLLLTKHKFSTEQEFDAKKWDNPRKKVQNNKCEIVNPQRFVVCEQTLPAENGKTHFMGKMQNKAEKSLKIFWFQFYNICLVTFCY